MCAGAQHNVIDNPVRQDAAPGSSRGVAATAAAAAARVVEAPGREFYIIRLSISRLEALKGLHGERETANHLL